MSNCLLLLYYADLSLNYFASVFFTVGNWLCLAIHNRDFWCKFVFVAVVKCRGKTFDCNTRQGSSIGFVAATRMAKWLRSGDLVTRLEGEVSRIQYPHYTSSCVTHECLSWVSLYMWLICLWTLSDTRIIFLNVWAFILLKLKPRFLPCSSGFIRTCSWSERIE